MIHLGIVELLLAEREREIETNLQRQRRLRSEDAAVEPAAPVRPAQHGRPMAIRARPTGS
jgi:hypothetical protein